MTFMQYDDNFGKKIHSTIMVVTSIYRKISIVIEIEQSWNFCDMATILKKNYGSEQNFHGTIMFATSINPKIINFHCSQTKLKFWQYGSHLKKKWWLGTKLEWYHHVRHINIPQDINFHWNRTKLKFLQYGGHFEKKMVARNKISMVPSCSPRQITPRYQFSLKSDKVDIFAKWQPFWKKNGGSVNNFNSTITFPTQNTTCSSWN